MGSLLAHLNVCDSLFFANKFETAVHLPISVLADAMLRKPVPVATRSQDRSA